MGDGKDIGISDSQHDVAMQINEQMNLDILNDPDASVPVRCKITSLKKDDLNDSLSAGWKDIRDYIEQKGN